MASLSFTSTVLDEGTTFFFGSWICIANGLGGFNSHPVDSRKPEQFGGLSPAIGELHHCDALKKIHLIKSCAKVIRENGSTSKP
jgi:hypothetical protein